MSEDRDAKGVMLVKFLNSLINVPDHNIRSRRL